MMSDQGNKQRHEGGESSYEWPTSNSERLSAAADARSMLAKHSPPKFLNRLIDRADLSDNLNALRTKKLTIVKGPPGYGKTTLLTQLWARLDGEACLKAWLTLDEAEQEAAQFLSAIAAAITSGGISVNQLRHETRLGQLSASNENALMYLLREIAVSQTELVLFIEDYQLVECAEIDTLFDKLLREQPSNLHIIVSTRTSPGYPLSHLRLSGQIQEIDENNLRFSIAELRQLLGVPMEEQELGDLYSRIEGWPAAARLARLWIKAGRDVKDIHEFFRGGVDEVASFMAEEIFSSLPESIRDFLVDTSILDRIHPELANAVCARDDSEKILKRIDRLGTLMFRIEFAAGWRRHHQLFSEFLQLQLSKRKPQHINQLHARASRWFEENDFSVQAVEHASRSGDHERAIALADRYGSNRFAMSKGLSGVKRFLNSLPKRAISERPRLLGVQALVLMKEGRLAEGCEIINRVQRNLREGKYGLSEEEAARVQRDILVADALSIAYQDRIFDDDTVLAMEDEIQNCELQDAWYQGFLHNILCLQYFRLGKMEEATQYAHAALNLYRDTEAVYGQIFMNVHSAMLALSRASLGDAKLHLDEADRLREHFMPRDVFLISILSIYRAEMYYEMGDNAAAEELIFHNLPIVEQNEGWVELYQSAYRTSSELAFARGGIDAAEKNLMRGEAVASNRKLPRLRASLFVQRLQLMLRAEQFDEVEHLIEEAGFRGNDPAFWGNNAGWREFETAELVSGLLSLGRFRPEEALEVLETVERRCIDYGQQRCLIKTHIMMARAYQLLDKQEQLVDQMEKALTLSQSHNLTQPFVEEPYSTELLNLYCTYSGVSDLPGEMLDWTAELLASMEGVSKNQKRSLARSLLTDREMEILNALCDGSSNKVIARKLDVTDHAVKFHLRNIYQKLGVNNRKLAIAVAQKLGALLPASAD